MTDRAICNIPRASLVINSNGKRDNDEQWILIAPQVKDDWNYWIVLRCTLPPPSGLWVVHRIVPWWGRYVWWDHPAMNRAKSEA